MAVARKRRRKTAAAPRRRRRRVTSSRGRRRNPQVANSHRPRTRRRRRATSVSRRRSSTRRRNPALFGSSVSGTKMAQAVLGGLVGVTGVKLLVPALPSAFNATPTMRALSSIGAAFLVGWAGGRIDKTFGDSMLFGGLMQAGSVILNTFLPGIGSQIALGDFVPGRFPVPQNPVDPMMISAGVSGVGVGTMNGAFTPAFA